jgi:hypothetical protein
LSRFVWLGHILIISWWDLFYVLCYFFSQSNIFWSMLVYILSFFPEVLYQVINFLCRSWFIWLLDWGNIFRFFSFYLFDFFLFFICIADFSLLLLLLFKHISILVRVSSRLRYTLVDFFSNDVKLVFLVNLVHFLLILL